MSNTLDLIMAEHGGGAAASPTHSDFRSDDAVFERCQKYVDKMPAAISGENGSAKTFHVACVALKGFELTTSQTMEILKEFNGRCDPPWSDYELQHKIDDAAKASGGSGYLRNTKPERYESVAMPIHPVPTAKPLQEKKSSGREITPTRTTLRAAVDRSIEHSATGKQNLIDLGIPELNRAIGGGAEFGEMIMIAARPSHGKSAIALQIVATLTKNGIECAIFSEEMNALTLGKRVLQFVTDTSEHLWRSNQDKLHSDVDGHFQERAECHVIEGCRTSEKVADEVRALAKTGVRAVVVDYVQLLSSKGNRYETVTENSVQLRKACSETGVLMIVLAQMSRGIEARDSPTPKTSDLRESGQLEQDADVLLFLVWPWKMDPTKEKYGYMIYVQKNRNRELVTHLVKCTFDPSRQRIEGLVESFDWADKL